MKKVVGMIMTLAILLTVLLGGQMGYAAPLNAQIDATDGQIMADKLDKKMKKKLYQTSSKQLSSYYTVISDDSTEERIHNIRKAARRINGTVLEPNQQFSYNQEVGNSNLAQDGWEKAGAIINGQLVEEYGGGICQVSSTLYNAVAKAGLAITERHSHSKPVRYVPIGQDATVAYGWLDFRFVNPYDFPVKIKAKVYKDTYVLVRIVRAD